MAVWIDIVLNEGRKGRILSLCLHRIGSDQIGLNGMVLAFLSCMRAWLHVLCAWYVCMNQPCPEEEKERKENFFCKV